MTYSGMANRLNFMKNFSTRMNFVSGSEKSKRPGFFLMNRISLSVLLNVIRKPHGTKLHDTVQDAKGVSLFCVRRFGVLSCYDDFLLFIILYAPNSHVVTSSPSTSCPRSSSGIFSSNVL